MRKKRRRKWAAHRLITVTESLLPRQQPRIMMMPTKEMRMELMRKLVVPEAKCLRARRKRIRRKQSDLYLSL
jgi:hypothetical protein